MKKVLFVATVDSHIRHFHIPYLKYFKEKGYEVHVATSDNEGEMFDFCDVKHKITFERSPFKINNLKAINQMVKLLKDEKFDVVHCHTPMGSVVTRLAVRKLRKKDKKLSKELGWSPKKDMEVIYTAHGFHFYKGAPLLNWLIYYPVEKWLAKYTDKLITINKEDYEYAKSFKAKKAYMIDGIGVDGSRFAIRLSEDEKKMLREELSSINANFKINKDDIVITYVAELIPRKHQDFLIKAIKELIDKDEKNSNLKVLIVGTGILEQNYNDLITQLQMKQNILLTGYRKDVPKLFNITDICVSTSRQEGLGLNLIEGLLCEVPVLASNVRGHNEIVVEEQNGYLYTSDNYEEFEEKLSKLVKDKQLRDEMSKNAVSSVQRFLLTNSVREMKEIYEEEVR